MRTLPFGRSVRRAGGAGVILGITLAVGAVASTASAGTVFTWDPRALTVGVRAGFTADTINGHALSLRCWPDDEPQLGSHLFFRADNGFHDQ